MRRPSLLLRIHGFGLLMLVGVGVLVGVVGVALVKPQARATMEAFAGWVLEQALEARGEQAQHRQIERAERLGLRLLVLDAQGLSSGQEPPETWARLTGAERASLTPGHLVERPGGSLALGAFAGSTLEAIAVMAPPPPPFSLSPPVLVVSGSLLLFALLSIPMARSLTRPLGRLATVARRLGDGDLTARAPPMVDEELAALASAFNDMADAIERLRRTERELLANVSHELRTPMARLRVVLELIADGDPARAHTYVNELSEDLGELERMTEDIIATARLELTGTTGSVPPLRLEPVDLGALCERSLARLPVSHPHTVVSHSPTTIVVQADAKMLRRALDNVLDNARKYSPEGSPIEVTLTSTPDLVRLTVRDQGSGLREEDLARVFTPFFRADRSRTRSTGGVGLGLLLTRRILEAHGGSVTLSSRLGQGTLVTFELPARVVPLTPPAPAPFGPSPRH